MSHSYSIHPSIPSTDQRTNLGNLSKILLIGESGAGKSTLINYFTNYFLHGSLNNLKVAIPSKYHQFSTENFSHDESNINDNTRSKTNTCTQYIFTDSNTSKQYLFLDTPGLADTRGNEQNDANITKIIDAITELGDLTSIIIVVNGSNCRLTGHFRRIIDLLHGNIPDIILENVIVILTNVKKHESLFDLNVLNLHGKVYPFHMQNDAFASDPRIWRAAIRDELQYDWEYSMNQIKCILQIVDSFKQISIDSFLQLKQTRNEIRSILHQAHLELIQIQKIHDEIFQLDQEFRLTNQTIEKTEIIDADYHSTLCANCNYVCHNNCHLNETTGIGAHIFTQCLVMLNGKCQQCPNHCPYINHYHAKKAIRIGRESLNDVLTEYTKKYDQGEVNRTNYQERILTISETKQLLEKALTEEVREIKRQSVKLCQICSSINLTREFKYLIKRLKSDLNLLKNREIQKQTDTIIRSLMEFTNSVEKNQDKHRHQRPSMQVINREQPIQEKSIDIKSQKTIDLIKLYHNTIDHNLITLILNELHQRTQGKSIGPLLTSDEILSINKYLEKYNQKNVQELSCLYRQLQKQIHKIINTDVLKIIHIDTELLIENFIVQILLDKKESIETNPQETFSSIPSLPPSHRPNPVPKPLQPTGPLPYPNTLLTSLDEELFSISEKPIGFSHLTSIPYPLENHSSPMPASSDYYSPMLQNSSFPHKRQSTFTDRQEHRSVPTQMPSSNPRETIQLQNHGFQFAPYYAPDRTSRPDVIPCHGNSYDPYKPLSAYLSNKTYSSFDTEDLQLLDNSKLLSMYGNATIEGNKSRQDAIYHELQQRCYGDHPMLIMENKSLFEETCRAYETKTDDELVRAQSTIQKKIREHLKDDDAKLINNIPSELIVEANVLNQLISSKRH
ncbi:hypothetical protein I4U23_018644 [Adineta vaga]|nr:hypothetical protein I4U23_018644 [Adineta vaga]